MLLLDYRAVQITARRAGPGLNSVKIQVFAGGCQVGGHQGIAGDSSCVCETFHEGNNV